MRPTSILTSGLLWASTCAAWPAAFDSLATAIKQEIAPLYRREGTTSFDLSLTLKQGNTATTVSSSSQSSDSQSTGSGTGTVTGTNSKQTGTATSTGASTGKKGGSDSEPTTQTFNPEDPPGGLSMITPAATTMTYYKIADYVTFAWNYTSLSVTPSYVDILASCSSNAETWTIALNESVSGPTQAVTWDTGEYQSTATLPLLTGEYTLLVYDAQKPMTAAASAGYLAPFSAFTFGMYTPQTYTPLNEYVCATCNAGVTAAQVQTLWFLLGTAGVTMLSAAWFTGVAGLW